MFNYARDRAQTLAFLEYQKEDNVGHTKRGDLTEGTSMLEVRNLPRISAVSERPAWITSIATGLSYGSETGIENSIHQVLKKY